MNPERFLQIALESAEKYSYEDLRKSSMVSLLGSLLHLQAVYDIAELRNPADPQLAIIAAMLKRMARYMEDLQSLHMPVDFKVRPEKLAEAKQHVLASSNPEVAKLNRIYYTS